MNIRINDIECRQTIYKTREPDINLITVGSRLLDLSDEDRETFFRVYKISQELIMEEMSKGE